MVYQVFIKTLTGRILTINLGNTEEEMQSVTVGQLKTKIFQMEGIPEDRQRLFFAGKQLEDIKRLFECRIQKEDTIHLILKRKTVDQLNPALDDEDQGLRVEMSCGHSVTPSTLTGFCHSLLDQGKYKFKCPAIKDGTLEKCDALWSYQEVRRLAVLTTEEMQHFEKTMACLAAAEYCDFKTCPGCQCYVERENLTNLCVQCLVCTADQKKKVQFCWQCLKPWKGSALHSDRCDNGCKNHDLELLRTCKTTSFPEVQGVENCPSIRACPTCGHKVEHDKTGCKNIICPRCQVEFCFVCLKLTPECLKTSSYFIPCSDGVAPRQTAIPVWHRK